MGEPPVDETLAGYRSAELAPIQYSPYYSSRDTRTMSYYYSRAGLRAREFQGTMDRLIKTVSVATDIRSSARTMPANSAISFSDPDLFLDDHARPRAWVSPDSKSHPRYAEQIPSSSVRAFRTEATLGSTRNSAHSPGLPLRRTRKRDIVHTETQ